MNNIYDKKFELYLIKRGYNLDTISLNESLKQLKIYRNATHNKISTKNSNTSEEWNVQVFYMDFMWMR